MLSKEEIEKDNTFKISMPLITDEDIRKIDNNFENIVKEFTKSYVKEKDLVLAQYIMKKQQDKLDHLESDKQNLIEKLEEIIKETSQNINPEAMKKYQNLKMEEINDETYILLAMHRIGFAGEILEIVKGENHDNQARIYRDYK